MGTRDFNKRRNAMVYKYRQKMRQWTMDVMPTMPDDQWKQFTEWVAAWGRRSSSYQMSSRAGLNHARERARANAHKVGGLWVSEVVKMAKQDLRMLHLKADYTPPCPAGTDKATIDRANRAQMKNRAALASGDAKRAGREDLYLWKRTWYDHLAELYRTTYGTASHSAAAHHSERYAHTGLLTLDGYRDGNGR